MKPRVFIVEDNLQIVELYKYILKTNGYELAGVAVNGEDAIRAFTSMEPRPDIVIMDQRLPHMSGIEATREILRTDPKTRVLFVSADMSSREGALSIGAAGFIVKPFEVHDLIAHLATLSDESAPD